MNYMLQNLHLSASKRGKVRRRKAALVAKWTPGNTNVLLGGNGIVVGV